MTPEQRAAKIQKLFNGTLLDRDNSGAPSKTAVKLGHGYNNIVIDNGEFRVNQENPGDPSLKMTREDGTIINTGSQFQLSADFKAVSFNKGTQTFQPVADSLASTTANPLPTIRQALPEESLWTLSDNGTRALAIIKGLLGIG